MLALFIAAPSIASAHEGHAHKVMGTISSVQGTNLMVKGADGKEVMVMLDAKTKITQGKAKVEASSSLKVGDRIVAEGPEEKNMIMATTVKLGEAPAAAKEHRAQEVVPVRTGSEFRWRVLGSCSGFRLVPVLHSRFRSYEVLRESGRSQRHRGQRECRTVEPEPTRNWNRNREPATGTANTAEPGTVSSRFRCTAPATADGRRLKSAYHRHGK
jgi:hypothetical protein